MPQDRYIPYIDQGEHDFSFLFRFGTKGENAAAGIQDNTGISRHAHAAVLLSATKKNPEKKTAPVQLLHTDTIQFVTLKKSRDGEHFFVRRFNPTDKEQSAVLHFQDKKEAKAVRTTRLLIRRM